MGRGGGRDQRYILDKINKGTVLKVYLDKAATSKLCI